MLLLGTASSEVTGKRFFAKGVAYNPRNESLGLDSCVMETICNQPHSYDLLPEASKGMALPSNHSFPNIKRSPIESIFFSTPRPRNSLWKHPKTPHTQEAQKPHANYLSFARYLIPLPPPPPLKEVRSLLREFGANRWLGGQVRARNSQGRRVLGLPGDLEWFGCFRCGFGKF